MPEHRKVLDEALLLVGESNLNSKTSIIADLEYRAEVGLDKYGTYLSTENGRSAIIDLYEELLDALMYATQRYMETESDQDMLNAENLLNILHDIVNVIRQDAEGRGFLRGRAPEPQPPLFEGDFE